VPAIVKKLADGSATLGDLSAFPDVAGRLAEIARATNLAPHLDDVDRAPGYYTGLRFRAYDAASRSVLAQGGRYDDLYGRFGTNAPAVGFTVTVDALEEL
jgi:ATP phosphoribosyltransferase regulatory subunit HisZ